MWSNFGWRSTPSSPTKATFMLELSPHVARVVDEHSVVEARFLRFELHEDVGQVVGALGHRVQRRLDGIGRWS
jgi:hypothetical protein